ncbi:MAG: chemotaxis protein CheV [bacterium]|nr:chemotaxis protein CheV [bacterium]
MGQRILLEAGTNELELLVFQVAGTSYGINVAKVRELVPRMRAIALPGAPDAVDGTIRLREEILTLVNLGRYLGEPAKEDDDKGLIIVIEFNMKRCGVLVDGVEMIHRLKWDQVDPPSKYLIDLEVPITGVCKLEDNVVQILDFEAIVGEVLGLGGEEANTGDGPGMDAKSIRILVADDSGVIRSKLVSVLRDAGFEDLTVCQDGQEAWETIEAGRAPDTLPFDVILSDIEMPRMDGLHLTARIKEDPQFQKMPVILFSSLISPENANKGRAVGADAQVTKFQSDELVGAIEKCLGTDS